jgi:hypothetical protein
MSQEQGGEVAELFASRLYTILYNNNLNNEQFQYLIRSIEKIRNNNDYINSYKTVLNSTSIDPATRSNYEAAIAQYEQANQTIMQLITNNPETMLRLNQSIAIENSVILREIENLRRGGGGTSNQFIDSIDRL